MTLPEVAVFEDFLAGARVTLEPPSADPSELFHSSTTSVHGSGVTLWLAYRPSALQMDSVLKKIAEALAAAGGPSSRAVALAVLALIVETKGPARHVEHANRLLAAVRQSHVLLNFVSPGPAPVVDIRADYGVVGVESFDPAKLEYWARRGGAQWPIATKELRGRVAFVSELKAVTLINIDRLPGGERLLKKWGSTAPTVVDAYFQAVADTLVDKLTTETARRLSLAEAAGIAGLDLRSIASWSLGVHLFTWPSSSGSRGGSWAIFRQPGLVLNTPPAQTWEQARQWLLKEFGIDNLSGNDRPIDITAQAFAALVQDARAHQAGGRIREAFLYFIIALDHLLGEEGRNVSTVADRASVLTHSLHSTSFDNEVARVRRAYDVRSRLVHSGSPVVAEDLRDADAIARGALWAITRVIADETFESRDEWVAKIDALGHLLRGDPEVVTEDRLAAVGAVSTFRVEPPPPMLRGSGIP